MNDFWISEPRVAQQLQHVRSFIVSSLEHANPFIRDLLLERVASGGKLIRPGLVIVGSALGTEEREDAVVRIASVLEMIHIASLIHDDIIDGAKMRRGIPTINALLDPKKAVIAGDYLLSRAMSLINGTEGQLPVAVANAFSRLVVSELDQDAGIGNFFISQNTYIRRIAGKTAALFALSSYAGVAVAKGSALDQIRMHRIGYCLGIAFQIQDDMLDFTGDETKLGKEVGQDILGGIPTIPLITALEVESKTSTQKPLRTLLAKKKRLTRKESRRAVDLVIGYGGLEQAATLAEIYIQRAMTDINSISNSEVAAQLTRLYLRLTHRQH